MKSALFIAAAASLMSAVFIPQAAFAAEGQNAAPRAGQGGAGQETQRGHGQMGQMDHSKMTGMDHGQMDHGQMDHERRGPGDRANMFARMDTNGDGVISKAEFQAAHERMRKMRNERGPQKQGQGRGDQRQQPRPQ